LKQAKAAAPVCQRASRLGSHKRASRAYAVARKFNPLFGLIRVVGFIGPEISVRLERNQPRRIEDNFCGKLLGCPWVLATVCYTNHAEADQNEHG